MSGAHPIKEPHSSLCTDEFLDNDFSVIANHLFRIMQSVWEWLNAEAMVAHGVKGGMTGNHRGGGKGDH